MTSIRKLISFLSYKAKGKPNSGACLLSSNRRTPEKTALPRVKRFIGKAGLNPWLKRESS